MEEQRCLDLVRRYPKALGHLRALYEQKRFGLVLGSGVSRDFQIPDWRGLLETIAEHPDVEGVELLTRVHESPITVADLLRRHFDARMEPVLRERGLDDRGVTSELTGRWLRIVRDSLYRDAPEVKDLETSHPYIGHFLEIILRSPITVNYNFDSCIEMMLGERQRRLGIRMRPFEVAYDDFLATGVRTSLIFHPNGYLPKNVLEVCSSDIVLSEREFNAQLGDTFNPRTAFLNQHFSDKTCLFLGLSLQDDLLRSVLRITRRTNPGHFHYCVEWVGPEGIGEGMANAIFRSRFDNYNLITLFLTSEEIAVLGHLIALDADHFLRLAEKAEVNAVYTYYLTGVPGVGKTSTVRYFHSLQTYGEWAEDPVAELAIPFQELNGEQRERVDRWIARQFALKNAFLQHAREGIHLVDRTPLDPLSFTPHDAWSQKVALLRQALQDETPDGSVRNGVIIHLVGDSREIAARLAVHRRLGKEPDDDSYSASKLVDMEARLREIYVGEGVVIVDTRGLSLADVVRSVARVVFCSEYPWFDVNAGFERYSLPR